MELPGATMPAFERVADRAGALQRAAGQHSHGAADAAVDAERAAAHRGAAGIGVDAGKGLRAAADRQSAGAGDDAGEQIVRIGDGQVLGAQRDGPASREALDACARRA